MKRADIYPPGSEDPSRTPPNQPRVWWRHPLVWVFVVVSLLAGVGVYAELFGFYDLDSRHERHEDEEREHAPMDDKKSEVPARPVN